MAKPAKRKIPAGGRTTPKGTSGPSRTTPQATGRYTPPVPSEYKVSPIWVPILMFTLLGLGMLVIFLNYLGAVPGETSNWYLLLGLGLILAGIITATQYH